MVAEVRAVPHRIVTVMNVDRITAGTRMDAVLVPMEKRAIHQQHHINVSVIRQTLTFVL